MTYYQISGNSKLGCPVIDVFSLNSAQLPVAKTFIQNLHLIDKSAFSPLAHQQCKAMMQN